MKATVSVTLLHRAIIVAAPRQRRMHAVGLVLVRPRRRTSNHATAQSLAISRSHTFLAIGMVLIVPRTSISVPEHAAHQFFGGSGIICDWFTTRNKRRACYSQCCPVASPPSPPFHPDASPSAADQKCADGNWVQTGCGPTHPRSARSHSDLIEDNRGVHSSQGRSAPKSA